MSARPFRSRRPQRGMTLIEVMAASAVLSVAMLGLVSAQVHSSAVLAGANREVQATALAQELANALTFAPYTTNGSQPTGLLANVTTGNDADITDQAGQLDGASMADPVGSGVVDHAESELASSAVTLPLTSLTVTDPLATTAIYQRYWSVRPIQDPLNAARTGGLVISALVRYRTENGGWRHVAVLSTRFDPTQLRE